MSKFTFDSAGLYNTLLQAKAQIQQRINDTIGDEFSARIIWWGGTDQHWEVTIGKSYTEKCAVKGKHLEQCVEEALRRMGFSQQQENLQLTHEAEVVEPGNDPD